MTLLTYTAALTSSQADTPVQLDSLYQTLIRGGPVMIPLALCSVISLTWILERALRMRAANLGSPAQSDLLAAAVREGGPTKALDVARASPTVLSKIYQPVFERWDDGRQELEKAVEDSGSRELRALISSLRPLTVIAVCAPLLGLLGTVVGIIIAFHDIALSNAMGKPEALVTGISQALVTTATGLAIAIPTQVGYYWFRARIDRYRRLVEETGEKIFAARGWRPTRPAASAVPAPPPPAPVISPEQAPIVAQVAS